MKIQPHDEANCATCSGKVSVASEHVKCTSEAIGLRRDARVVDEPCACCGKPYAGHVWPFGSSHLFECSEDHDASGKLCPKTSGNNPSPLDPASAGPGDATGSSAVHNAAQRGVTPRRDGDLGSAEVMVGGTTASDVDAMWVIVEEAFPEAGDFAWSVAVNELIKLWDRRERATPPACVCAPDDQHEECPQHGRGLDGWIEHAKGLREENGVLRDRLTRIERVCQTDDDPNARVRAWEIAVGEERR